MKNLFPCIMLFLLVMQNKILIAQPSLRNRYLPDKIHYVGVLVRAGIGGM